MRNFYRLIGLIGLGAALASTSVRAADEKPSQVIGKAEYSFSVFGPKPRIQVEKIKDPLVPGVTCYLSRPVTGGLTESLGVNTDKSDSSLACRQTGPMTVDWELLGKIPPDTNVFSQKTNPWFKSMNVRRILDRDENTIVYLVFSEHLIDGSPKNAISAVTAMPWPK